jgi:hypothetical protein
MQKLPGVESINVSLERASADIQLRPGNSITLAQLRSIIKNNGFTAKEATVTVVGKLIERGGQPALDVTGTDTVFLIAPDPKQPAIFKQIEERQRAKAPGAVELTGLMESHSGTPDRIVVQGLSEDRR